MDAKAAGDTVRKGKLTKEQKKALKKQKAFQRKLAAEEARRQAIRVMMDLQTSWHCDSILWF